MERYYICTTQELAVGQRKIVQAAGRSIGVFNVNGSYYALRNSCPHQGAPLCKGRVSGTTLPSAPGTYVYGKEGEIVHCPWHGWEFDITTGKSIFDPHKCLVKSYEVAVEFATDEQLETYRVDVEEGNVILLV